MDDMQDLADEGREFKGAICPACHRFLLGSLGGFCCMDHEPVDLLPVVCRVVPTFTAIP